MKYAIEMGSGAMIYMTHFMCSKTDGMGMHIQTQAARLSHKLTFIFKNYGKQAKN
jgi:hypothetical protein